MIQAQVEVIQHQQPFTNCHFLIYESSTNPHLYRIPKLPLYSE